MADTETKAAEEIGLTENNLLIKEHLDIEASLQDPALPEKDREKLKSLRDELLVENLAKHRRKKLWKEVDWVINRKRRNDHKKVRLIPLLPISSVSTLVMCSVKNTAESWA